MSVGCQFDGVCARLIFQAPPVSSVPEIESRPTKILTRSSVGKAVVESGVVWKGGMMSYLVVVVVVVVVVVNADVAGVGVRVGY